MFKNIVYIGYAPLTAKTSRDFYITDLINNGRNVEYWDMSKYYFPNVRYNALDEVYVKKVNSLSELKQLLGQVDIFNTIFFINFPYSGHVMRLYRCLTKHNVKMAIIARGALPFGLTQAKRSISSLLQEGLFKKVKSVFLNRVALLIKKLGFINPFDRIYYAGEQAIRIAGVGHQMDLRSSQLIPVNSVDYDIQLLMQSDEKLVDYEYVVFLDAYLPHHPDTKMFGIKTVEPGEYYSSLNLFFEKIEREFQIRVVIAAHPKADLYSGGDFFKGRDVYFNKTIELIKYSKFVLAHCSTAISFAVLFNKAILFFYSDSIKELMWNYFSCICSSAQSLDATLVNISESLALNHDILYYSKSRYEDYKYKYLTSKETEHTLSSIIFTNSLKF